MTQLTRTFLSFPVMSAHKKYQKRLDKLQKDREILVKVCMPELSSLKVTGFRNVTVDNSICVGAVTMLTGSEVLNLALEGKEIVVTVSGSGKAILAVERVLKAVLT